MRILYQPDLITDLTEEDKQLLADPKLSLEYHKKLASYLNTALMSAFFVFSQEVSAAKYIDVPDQRTRYDLDFIVTQFQNVLAVLDKLDAAASYSSKAIQYHNLSVLILVRREHGDNLRGSLANLFNEPTPIEDQGIEVVRNQMLACFKRRVTDQARYLKDPIPPLRRSLEIFFKMGAPKLTQQDIAAILKMIHYIRSQPAQVMGREVHIGIVNFLTNQERISDLTWALILRSLACVIQLPGDNKPYADRLQRILSIIDVQDFYYDFETIYTGLVRYHLSCRDFAKAQTASLEGLKAVKTRGKVDLFASVLKKEVEEVQEAKPTPAFMFNSAMGSSSSPALAPLPVIAEVKPEIADKRDTTMRLG